MFSIFLLFILFCVCFFFVLAQWQFIIWNLLNTYNVEWRLFYFSCFFLLSCARHSNEEENITKITWFKNTSCTHSYEKWVCVCVRKSFKIITLTSKLLLFNSKEFSVWFAWEHKTLHERLEQVVIYTQQNGYLSKLSLCIWAVV